MEILPQERVIYEDNHLIIVYKEAGELTQGDATGDLPLLEKTRAYIQHTYQKPGNVFCGLIHRLDRPTSGLMVFAKTSKALARMNALFQERAVDKRYWAITAAPLGNAEGLLEHYLKKNLKQNKSYPVDSAVKGAKRAQLKYRLVGQSDRFYAYEIELLTGRHHQIRAQFAAEGAPIRGDLKYGFPRSNPDGNLSLHAATLAFIHPVSTEKLNFKAAYRGPDRVWQLFKWL